MISEKNFAGNSSYIFYSLALTDGLPYPTSKKKQRIFWKQIVLIKIQIILQLLNGTIVTLIHIDQENCGTMIRDNGFDNRVMTGSFMFWGSIEELKSSPVSMMIKYLTENEDYVIKKISKN
jgi:hypothetical protein